MGDTALWDISASQLAAFTPSVCAILTSAQISYIPPQAFVGWSPLQVTLLNVSCYGFTADQVTEKREA